MCKDDSLSIKSIKLNTAFESQYFEALFIDNSFFLTIKFVTIRDWVSFFL